ncbi:MAG: sigma 54-interacting transcriptional regulator, partial [Betaproteobacteria bacterium]
MQLPALSEAILDSLSEGVFTVDHDWKITSFNHAAEEITGILQKEALGQLCADVLHSSLCESHCPIKAAMDKQVPAQNQRCYFVDTEGSRVPISVSAAVLFDSAGKVLGGVETFRDLSEIEALRIRLASRSNGINSQSPAMQQVLAMVPVLADNPTSVLIQGETGTGKEVLARAIHNEGPRRSKPFVAINCGALPDHLLESELFGYKRGAFTGADRDKPGRFALVRDGTLFLDEIGDISPAMQVRLLRVLQEREFEPLGSTHSEPMRARIIAASHHNLQELVKTGQFREDLFYRLEVVRLEIPPLRARQ